MYPEGSYVQHLRFEWFNIHTCFEFEGHSPGILAVWTLHDGTSILNHPEPSSSYLLTEKTCTKSIWASQPKKALAGNQTQSFNKDQDSQRLYASGCLHNRGMGIQGPCPSLEAEKAARAANGTYSQKKFAMIFKGVPGSNYSLPDYFGLLLGLQCLICPLVWFLTSHRRRHRLRKAQLPVSSNLNLWVQGASPKASREQRLRYTGFEAAGW